MYKDPSIKVRQAISWMMSKVCENHADVMTQTPELTSLFVETLITSLEDRPKIS